MKVLIVGSLGNTKELAAASAVIKCLESHEAEVILVDNEDHLQRQKIAEELEGLTKPFILEAPHRYVDEMYVDKRRTNHERLPSRPVRKKR